MTHLHLMYSLEIKLLSVGHNIEGGRETLLMVVQGVEEEANEDEVTHLFVR